MFLKTEPNKQAILSGTSRRWSIARRLTMLYAASSCVMLVLAAVYLYWSLVEHLERDDNAFLANSIQECRRLLHEHPDDEHFLAHEIQVEAAASQFIKYYLRLLDSDGRILLETPRTSKILPLAAFPPAVEAGQVPTQGTVWKCPSGESYLLMSALAEANPEGTTPRILQVALDVSVDEAVLRSYQRKLLAVVVLGILFSAAVGVFVARKGLQPLEEITKATDRITASQLHERTVATAWPEELASLARSFDRMLDRLQDSFNRLSQFSADLAHEIRTPINNLRGEAGVALSQPRTPAEYRSTLESSLEEYARLSRLIDNLLFLARAEEATAKIARATFDARRAVEVVREFYEAFAEDRGIEIVCDGQGVLHADPVLFRQAVSNLLSNALNFTDRGGNVRVMVQQQDGQPTEVIVTDTGCGIASEHLLKIFDRFYRVDPARSQQPCGSGLGLAIVKSIMTLHGGSVTVQSTVGKGSAFILTFPANGIAVAPRR